VAEAPEAKAPAVPARNRDRQFAALLKVAALAALGALSYTNSWAAPRAELQDLRGRIEKLQKDLQDSEVVKTEASDALRASERAISESNRQLRELDGQRQQAADTLGALGRQNKQAGERLAAQQAALAGLLYQQYLNGQHDSLTLLLNQRDPGQLARDLRYYGYISRARADLIEGLRRSLDELQRIESQQRTKAADLARIEAEQLKQKQELRAQQTAHRGVLAKVSAQIRAQRRQIGSLQRDEKRLTRLVERLSKLVTRKPRSARPARPSQPDVFAPGAAFQRLKGKLGLPVRGELVNRFGSPRQDTGMVWKGVFIRARSGQEVKAVAGGQVVFADWLRGFGNLIILDHDDGFMSLYGNNEALYKRVGETVASGEAIAAVGNSGGNADSGLYFELRYQSRPFDPMAWIGLK
jgi:septal ring factor EnvC (AmiA/AmiB activator)